MPPIPEEASADQDLSQLFRSRRSVRLFRPQALNSRLIADILADAVWAPSPHNSQPWRFTVLTRAEDKQALADRMAHALARELEAFETSTEEIERQTERSRGRILSAPVAIVLSLVPDGLHQFPDERRSQLEWLMAVQSVGAVLQNVFLLAQLRGIGTCWMAAPMYCPQVVVEVLQLPNEYVPQALVLMGYPASSGKVRDRRPLETVVDARAGD